MKYLKLILSIAAGVMMFYALISVAAILDILPLKELHIILSSIVITFISVSITVLVTDIYKQNVAIFTGAFVNFIYMGFLVVIFHFIDPPNNSILILPVVGGVAGWLSFKYSPPIMQIIIDKVKSIIPN